MNRRYGNFFPEVTPALLKKLVDTHLLRAEVNHKGKYTYELSHDTLIAPILKNKKERLEALAAEKKVAEEKRRQELEAEALKREAERRKRRLLLLGVILFSILSALAIGLAIYGFRQQRIAEAERGEALQQKQIAESLQETADSLRLVAELEANTARRNEEQAIALRRRAEASEAEARRLAKRAEALAIQAKAEASKTRQEKNRADSLLIEAQRNEEAARQKSAEADTLRSQAERTASLTLQYNNVIKSWNAATRGLKFSNDELPAKAALASYIYELNAVSDQGDIYYPDLYKLLYRTYDNENPVAFSNFECPVRDLFYQDQVLWAASSCGISIQYDISSDDDRLLLPTDFSEHRSSMEARFFMLPQGRYQLLGLKNTNTATLIATDSSKQEYPIKLPAGEKLWSFLPSPIDSNTYYLGGTQGVYIMNGLAKPPRLLSSMPSAVLALSFMDDGSLIALVKNGRILVVADGKDYVNAYQYEQYAGKATSLLRQQEYFCVGTRDGELSIYDDISKRGILLKAHDSRISQLEISPGGRWLAAGSYDGTVSLWDLQRFSEASYQPLMIDDLSSWVLAIEFSSDEDWIYIGTRSGMIHAFSLQPGFYARQLCETINEEAKSGLQYWLNYFELPEKENLCD
jgi:WD40 repeat protein